MALLFLVTPNPSKAHEADPRVSAFAVESREQTEVPIRSGSLLETVLPKSISHATRNAPARAETVSSEHR
jgi:hypothetical protein